MSLPQPAWAQGRTTEQGAKLSLSQVQLQAPFLIATVREDASVGRSVDIWGGDPKELWAWWSQTGVIMSHICSSKQPLSLCPGSQKCEMRCGVRSIGGEVRCGVHGVGTVSYEVRCGVHGVGGMR